MDHRPDNETLISWCNMETMNEYLQKPGTFVDDYFAEVKRKIKQCEEFLGGDNKFLGYYTLAELYSRFDMDELPEYPNKRKACYYALKTICEDRFFAPAWALLAEVYDWAVFCGGIEGVAKYLADQDESVIMDKDEDDDKHSYLSEQYELDVDQLQRIKLAERAIFCMKKAIALDPANENYRFLLKNYHHQRNEEYKPLHIHRNPPPLS